MPQDLLKQLLLAIFKTHNPVSISALAAIVFIVRAAPVQADHTIILLTAIAAIAAIALGVEIFANK